MSCSPTPIPATSPGSGSRPTSGASRTARRPSAPTAGAPRARDRRYLQGLAVCGVGGQRMTVRYHARRGRLLPDYRCQRKQIETATGPCRRIPGAGIDRAAGELLVEPVSPAHPRDRTTGAGRTRGARRRSRPPPRPPGAARRRGSRPRPPTLPTRRPRQPPGRRRTRSRLARRTHRVAGSPLAGSPLPGSPLAGSPR